MNLVLTNQKWMLLIVGFILGVILLYSYYHYITKGGVPIKTLWGGAAKVKPLYMASLILAAISFVIVWVYAIFKTPNTSRNGAIISNLMAIQVVILAISMIWLPMTILYVKEGSNKQLTMFAVLLTLFIVALAAFKQISLVSSLTPENNECAKTMKKIAKLGAGYFFIHVFFFDFIGWDIGFFGKLK